MTVLVLEWMKYSISSSRDDLFDELKLELHKLRWLKYRAIHGRISSAVVRTQGTSPPALVLHVL